MWTEAMHNLLDGDLGEAERARLDADLSRDPQARAELERLRRVHAVLSELPRLSAPRGLARSVAQDIALSRALHSAPPPTVPSVAALTAARVAEEAHPDVVTAMRSLPRLAPPAAVAPVVAARVRHEAQSNPAPLLLVGGLVLAFAVLVGSFAWPNLAAGATVLRALLSQVSPLAFVGLALAFVTALIVTWRPVPRMQWGGALAFSLAAALTLPSAYGLFTGRGSADVVRVGGNVVVDRAVPGNVIALGGNVVLRPGASVGGQAVAFLGDVRQEPGATVTGSVSALLGDVAGAPRSLETRPLPALGTASAFQPLLEWIGGAAWTRIYVVAIAAIMLLLFLSGVAPQLARRQRYAPVRTFALGTLVMGLAVPPLVLGALSGFLVPAFVGSVLLLLALSVGLSVSLHDAGRAMVRTLRLPHAEVLGALLGLSLFAAALSAPPLAFALWALGGVWGAGTLLLARPILRA